MSKQTLKLLRALLEADDSISPEEVKRICLAAEGPATPHVVLLPDELLTRGQAAALLRMGRTSFFNFVCESNAPELKRIFLHDNSRPLWSRRALEQFIEKRKAAAGASSCP
jgi:hypothetical protein